MRTSWVRLDVALTPGAEDAATLRLHELGVPGWEVLEARGGTVLRLWCLPEDARELAARIRDGVEGCRGVEERAGEDDGWRRDWTPERVGPFVVTSLGAPEPTLAAGEHRITLAPALAFGGGEHPTTRLCLLALTELELTGGRVLDVGSGSGVLSVAAMKLGAASVSATDVDRTALRATRRAAEASGVEVEIAPALDALPGPYDVVVANILAPVLVELAPALRSRAGPRGRVLLSGLREGAEGAVLAAYAPLRLLESRAEGGWLALLLAR